MSLWFRMYDPDPKHETLGGMHRIEPETAAEWNEKHFGIFWTVQNFIGQRRVNEDLEKIKSWAIDIDYQDKITLIKQISDKSGICPPSRIVETKSGLHVYWHAISATPDLYRSIVEDRLGSIFSADPKAKDLARVLRVPGFRHWKNPKDPFMIRTLIENCRIYTEEEMIHAFKLPRMYEQLVIDKQELRQSVKTQGENFFDKLWSMDQMAALSRISGTDAVNGEIYTFKKSPKGRFNIIVNGKDSGCFIGEERRIGSGDGGGPTIANWLRWFGRSWKDTIKFLKLHFPELREQGDPI